MRIEKRPLTKDDLKIIKKIDNLFYHDKKLTLSWYLARYNENNIAYFLVNQDRLVVGYVAIANIKEELYNLIKSGSIRNDIDLSPIMYDHNSKYHYLSSIVILDEYQKLGYGQKLLNCAIKEYNHHLITITISESGYALMNKVMKQVIRVDEKIIIFEYAGENN